MLGIVQGPRLDPAIAVAAGTADELDGAAGLVARHVGAQAAGAGAAAALDLDGDNRAIPGSVEKLDSACACSHANVGYATRALSSVWTKFSAT